MKNKKKNLYRYIVPIVDFVEVTMDFAGILWPDIKSVQTPGSPHGL